MKITEVYISGMHKAYQKSYKLNPGTTYFIGENGAGKSTILEAIQLALLGYIPGYAKTKDGIMKHSSGKLLEVKLKLDSDITIERTWMRSAGGSVTSEINVTGYDGDLIDLLGGIELPILDFNEFTALTANKLKEWFINFLPDSSKDFDIVKELVEDANSRQLATGTLLDDISNWIKDNTAGLKGLDVVKLLNTHLKEEQSFIKGQISKLQGTIDSLIYYEDAPQLSKEDLDSKLEELNEDKMELLKAAAAWDAWDKMMLQVKLMEASLHGNSCDDDVEYKAVVDEYNTLHSAAEANKDEYNRLSIQLDNLNQSLRSVPSGTSSICPYTKEVCESAAKLAESSKAEKEKITEKIKATQEQLSKVASAVDAARLRTLESTKLEIERKYLQLSELKHQIGPEPRKPKPNELPDVEKQINTVQEDLIKIAANEKYNELTQSVTSEKFKLENELEVIKSWIKLTDANGLQTTLMNDPFKDLADDMSKYLSQIFNTEIIAKFNLTTKANSFSFGLMRNDNYVEFDCLSSGERCLFTLALMMCILDRSKSEINVILVDDLLDHLDTDNAKSLFKSLKGMDNIQFILAGVKECAEEDICQPV